MPPNKTTIKKPKRNLDRTVISWALSVRAVFRPPFGEVAEILPRRFIFQSSFGYDFSTNERVGSK